MNDTILNNIYNTILLSVSEISLIDVFSDEISFYEYSNKSINLKEKSSLTSYIDKIKNSIHEEYLKDYMNSISIPKLEEQKLKGNDCITVEYKTLNNTSYTNICSIIENNNTKYILVITNKNNSVKEESNAKYNSLVEAISDSILKVQNVFSLGDYNLSNKNSIEDYINSVFSILINSYPEIKKSLNETVANVTGRSKDSILIVDDDLVTRNMIKKIFDGEYKIIMAKNGKEAIDYLNENSSKGINENSDHVVGIFLDLTMPVLDGFAVLEYLSKQNYLSRIPVIIISGDYEKETKNRVYNYNIADMLEKPFDFEVVRHRIKNFINLYKSSNSLADLINNQNENLKELLNIYINVYEEDYKNNIRRINSYINILGKKLTENGNYSTYNIEKIADASRYYDIGFYTIPRTILSKNNEFTGDEISAIKKYPLSGIKMLDYVLSLIDDEEYKKYAYNITKCYHENYDGTGYPNNLSSDNIPFEARLASVCIMYNNLLKKGNDNAKEIIISKKGTMFDENIINGFIEVVNEFEKVD